MREQLEQLRKLNEEHENEDSVIEVQQQKGGKGLDMKLEDLKKERKKEIEKLKLGL